MSQVNLRAYDNSWYSPGRPAAWRAAWIFFGLPLLRCSWIVSSSVRVNLLRAFGARIGRGVVMQQPLRVKYPWHLVVGDDCWFGEDCWIDNLTTVRIGSNVCISQGAYLCTGNHNWTDPHFGLMVAPITLADGAWVGARCVIAPGVVLGTGAIASAGSVITASIPDFEIHTGNPARCIRMRTIEDVAARRENGVVG
jgi:putative colanic acid biosynthesis acetyltransferase WcaF